ncbi:MAG: hypothetical protein Q4G67_02395 [Actinomycetia bacterium]|nr:hypothetical protein [Actinomycetes bacterium]
MKSDEAKDIGRAAGTTLHQVTELVRGAHFAVSDTVYGLLDRAVGPGANPARAAQDTVTAGVYAAVGMGLNAAAQVAGQITAFRIRDDADRPSVHDGRAAHSAIAISLGLRGDTFAKDAASLAPDMHVRLDHHRVNLTADELAAAYPQATGEVVVFLHGLFETENAWQLGTHERPAYADRLQDDLALTPVMVRYNTGLRISDNATSLVHLVDDLVAHWPVEVTRLVLIGHSMGGLVIHGALALDPAWLHLATDTVNLGTPHHGSPIARVVGEAAERLGANERGRWVADFLKHRAVSLRDLMHGNVVEADWLERDLDDVLDGRTHPVPVPGVRHHAVLGVATAGRLPARWADHLGDFVVSRDSAGHAGAAPEAWRFAEDRVAVVNGVGHFGLLNHELVYGHIAAALAAPTPTAHD